MSAPTFRRSSQRLAPARVGRRPPEGYDLYPATPVPAGSVRRGLEAIAELVSDAVLRHRTLVRIDGAVGVDWDGFRCRLATVLAERGVRPEWRPVTGAERSPREIGSLVEPFLGGDDPIFGTRFTGRLADFFDPRALGALGQEPDPDGAIVFGCGAALVDADGLLVYVDLPKNEVQFRSRAGAVRNLGCREPLPPKPQYKRLYFVDWVAVRRHQADIVERVDAFVDEQRPDDPTTVSGAVLRDALDRMARTFFRVRPWFEPGPWGGQWMRERFPDLPRDVPNYAWSFELIAPENGLMVSDGDHRLEVSFDWLMARHHRSVLGEAAEWFGREFPIRFDFLDTVDGGNLSVQCHPRPEYIRSYFGETFTQDETYYILDCQEGAAVYLGFREGLDEERFRRELEESERSGSAVRIEDHVNVVPARRHDLFLIPHGTVHASGAGNMVLEISATPYIFTFKMYDWLRGDLDGKPRPLNIARAFENLRFERQGDRELRALISRPRLIEEGKDWRLVELPTHADHFYRVCRYEIATEVECHTDGSPHVLMLVEGERVTLEVACGARQRFHHAETFVVPAAAGAYRLANEGAGRALVLRASLEPQDAWPAWMREGPRAGR